MESKGMLQEFMAFVQKYGVLGLAIGFVTGGAAKALVDSLTANIISPIIELVTPKGGFAGLEVVMRSAADNNGTPIVLGYGMVIDALINFLVIMLFIFLAVKYIIAPMMSEDDHKAI